MLIVDVVTIDRSERDEKESRQKNRTYHKGETRICRFCLDVKGVSKGENTRLFRERRRRSS